MDYFALPHNPRIIQTYTIAARPSPRAGRDEKVLALGDL